MARREQKEKKPKSPDVLFVSPEKKKEQMREAIRLKFQQAFGHEDRNDPNKRQR